MNVIVVTGHVGRDANVRELDNGDLVADFSVADNWKQRDEDRTNWFRVSCFGGLAEFAEEYVLTGTKVTVIGQLRLREYEIENDDGEIEDRQSNDIYASRLEMVTWPDRDEEVEEEEDDYEDEEEEEEEEEPRPRKRKSSQSSKRRKTERSSRKRTPPKKRKPQRRDEDDDEDEEEDERPRKRSKKQSPAKRVKARVKPRKQDYEEEDEEEDIDEDDEYEDMEWEDD